MKAVYKKEIRAYFNSITGYLFLSFFLALIGLYFFAQNIYSANPNFSYALYGVRFYFIFLIPLLTMRIMAEENHLKTDQLLFTSPVSISKIMIGKYLATLSIYTIVIAIICGYPLILKEFGDVNLKMAYACILSFFCMGAAYLAIGMFISTITESQAFAAVMTFVVILVTSLSSDIGQLFPTDHKTALIIFAILILLIGIVIYTFTRNWRLALVSFLVLLAAAVSMYLIKPALYDGSVVKFFNWLSFSTRFEDSMYGIFNLSSIVYFISVVVLFLFLSIQTINKRRWN